MLRALLPPLILGVAGAAALIALAVWQMNRLAWKEGLIAGIEARMAAAPVGLPAEPDPERDALLRVEVEGTLLGPEIHVLSAIRELGPGFRIVAALEVAGRDGSRRIMADLGFVPERMKDPAARSGAGTAVQLTGFLHWPDETDGYTPEPDLGSAIWFAREVDAMAAALGTEPVLVTAERHDLGEWPLPRPPGADMPNNHLQYALTWALMALVWIVMSAVWVRARLRERSGG